MPMPSKLSPETQDRIAQLIRAGNTIEVSATASGIHRVTFYDWMRRGESEDPEDASYREFREAVLQAQVECEAALVTRIARAATNGSWAAAAWLLERRAPERWAKRGERSKSGGNNDPAGPEEEVDAFSELDELSPRRQRRAQVS